MSIASLLSLAELKAPNTTDLFIKQLPNAKDLPLPSYATEDSAGLDLPAAVNYDIELTPGERILVPTGLMIALPKGFEAQVRPRSGLAYKKGITVLNSPGTIDADYRGEINVLLINLGDSTFTISRGMRIAQLIIAPVCRANIISVENELPATLRGEGGFGSTGILSNTKQTTDS